MPDPNVESDAILREQLDLLGLTAPLQHADDGAPFLRFTYEVLGCDVRMLAWIRARAFQLRAWSLDPVALGDSALRLLNNINGSWRSGRLYYDLESTHVVAVTWAYATNRQFMPQDVEHAFNRLVDAASALLEADASFSRLSANESEVNGAMADVLQCDDEMWPLAPPFDWMPQIVNALKETGREFLSFEDGKVLVRRFLVSGERDFYVDLIGIKRDTIHLRARHTDEWRVEEGPATWRMLQGLNSRFALGAAVWVEGHLQYHLHLPAAHTAITTDLLEWLIDRAHAAMLEIEHHWPDAP